MNVIPVTLAISLCLTLTFILFFWREQTRQTFSSAERDALLPLAEEGSELGAKPAPLVLELKGRAPRHAHAHGACARRRASGDSSATDHAPCEGCAKRAAHGHPHA